MSSYGRDPVVVPRGYGQDPVVESGYGKDPLAGSTGLDQPIVNEGDALVEFLRKHGPARDSVLQRDTSIVLDKALAKLPSAPGLDQATSLAQPKNQVIPPRNLVDETGAAVIRGYGHAARSVVKTAAELLPGASQTVPWLAENFPEGPAPSRTDLLGKVVNFAGGFVAPIAAGPAAPGVFGAEGYSDVMDRTGNHTAAITAGILGVVFGKAPVGKLVREIPGIGEAVAKLGAGKVGKELTERVVDSLASGTDMTLLTAGTEAVARLGGAKDQDIPWVESFLGGALAHGALGTTRSRQEQERFNYMRDQAVEKKLITSAESYLIGDRPELLQTIMLARGSGYEVKLKPTTRNGEIQYDEAGDPRVTLRTRLDPVTQHEKALLNHNPATIAAYRTHLEGSGQAAEQPATLAYQLKELDAGKRPAVLFPDNNVPQVISTGLTTEKTSAGTFVYDPKRVTPEQLHTAVKTDTIGDVLGYGVASRPKQGETGGVVVVRDSNGVEKRAVGVTKDSLASVTAASQKIMQPGDTLTLETPEQVVQNRRRLSEFDSTAPWLALTRSQKAGYLRPVEDISDRPATQSKIAKAQRQATERLLTLQQGVQALDIGERAMMTAEVDAILQEKVESLLSKDNDSPAGARARVVRSVRELVPEDQQSSVLTTLNQLHDAVTTKFPQETQLGTIERMLEEVDTGAYPRAGVDTRQFLEAVRARIEAGDKEFLPASQRVRAAQEELQGLLTKEIKLETGRDALGKLVDGLPDDQQLVFAARAKGAKTVEDLKTLGKEIFQAQEDYLRTTAIEELVSHTAKMGKNPQRDSVLGKLGSLVGPSSEGKVGATTPASTAAKPVAGRETALAGQGQAPPERPVKAALKFRGKVYEGETHAEVMLSILQEKLKITKAEAETLLGTDLDRLKHQAKPGERLPSGVLASAKRPRMVVELLGIPDAEHLFITNRDRLVDRAEGTRLVGLAEELTSKRLESKTKQVESKDTKTIETKKPASPILITDSKTGYVKIDPKALREVVKSYTPDQLRVLADDVNSLLRKGQIEQGLIRLARKITQREQAKAVVSELKQLKDTKTSVRGAKIKHGLGYVADPVMIEAALYQTAKGDESSPTYQAFHGAMRDGYDQHRLNKADRSRRVSAATKEILGFQAETPLGEERLARYLNKKLPSGLTRAETFEVYGLSKGRTVELAKAGAEKDGKKYDTETILSELSDKDKQWFDRAVLAQLKNNAYIDKGFRTYENLNARPLRRVAGEWYPSTRNPEKVKLDQDFASFRTTLANELDVHKDRSQNAGKPFKIVNAYAKFLSVTDKLSMYGEMGKELYAAEALVLNKDFERTYKAKYGNENYKRLELYLSNIVHGVGHQPTVFDEFVNLATSGYAVSKTGLNVFSAAKQEFGILTLVADGTLSGRAIAQALIEGRGLVRSVKKDMVDRSGMGYDRYVGGDYLRQLVVMGEESILPGKMGLLRHYAMTLQRRADLHVMSVAWRAAELTAKQDGFKDEALKAEQERLFSKAIGRGQPTDNPLYASELEIVAKRSPAYRAALLFGREQNRVYNILRRQIVQAAQQPTAANFSRAGRGLLFGLVGNVLGAVAINELRRRAFAEPSSGKDLGLDTLSNIAGLYYLGGPVDMVAQGLIDQKRRFTDRLGGPITQILADAGLGAWNLWDGLNADGEVKSGVSRGESQAGHKILQAVDHGVSAASAALGLPIWSLWQQGKGLYRWTDDQLRLMTYLEAERAQLKADGQEKSPRGRVIDAAKERINKIHQYRAKGLLTAPAAQTQIERELRGVVR